MTEHFSNKRIDEIMGDEMDNYFVPIWNDVFKTVIPKNVLDVGCGNGLFSIYLKKTKGCNIAGIDSSEYALSLAKKRGFNKIIHVDDLCSPDLPVEKNSYDFILCKDVYEHLMSPDILTKSIRNFLVPNGIFLLHVPNQFSVRGRLKLLFSNNLDGYHYFPGSERWNYPHVRFFTKRSLLNLCEANGFICIQDFSFHFSDVPLLTRLKVFSKLQKNMARKNPDNWAQGITLLFKKS